MAPSYEDRRRTWQGAAPNLSKTPCDSVRRVVISAPPINFGTRRLDWLPQIQVFLIFKSLCLVVEFQISIAFELRSYEDVLIFPTARCRYHKNLRLVVSQTNNVPLLPRRN